MSAKGSELKRVRQAKKANLRNKTYKSMVHTSMKKVLGSTKKDEALTHLKDAVKTIDKVASKGIIHKNKASNKKSSLYKYTNNLK